MSKMVEVKIYDVECMFENLMNGDIKPVEKELRRILLSAGIKPVYIKDNEYKFVRADVG